MASRARDNFETYFAEKLWEMIPPVYREEDGLGSNPGALRGLVEVLAQQAALLRRSTDRLWEDEFVEGASDWVVAYLADLVGTRLVSSLNRRARRVDVAKTIYYRRRKGTARVLEELIADITGWDGKVVEEFRRLARARHGLDPHPAPLGGTLTGTPPGGFADLRSLHGAQLAHGPWDEFHHTPDVRRQKGRDGVYAIPKLAFHLYPLAVRPVHRVEARLQPANARAFFIDPSGRDVPLFSRRSRSGDWDQWHSAREWDVPAPIRCGLLNHAEYVITEEIISKLQLPSGDELRRFRNIRFPTEQRLRDAITTLPHGGEILDEGVFPALLAAALVSDCGKAALLAGSLSIESPPGTVIRPERIAAGNLENWTGAAAGKRVIVDPQRGRLLFLGDAPAEPPRVSCWYGFSAEIGAGGYDRSASLAEPTAAFDPAAIPAGGVVEIVDSRTYSPLANAGGITSLALQAADRQRPYLKLTSDWKLEAAAGEHATLTFEGLWIGAAGAFSVILAGHYERVTIRHSTIDPGGNPTAAVALEIAGRVEELVIENSIIATVRISGTGTVGTVKAQDSILGSIALDDARAELNRVTVFGAVRVDQLVASEALMLENVQVTNTQAGCFRFSAAPAGSRVPRAYESYKISGSSTHFFVSRVFGEPGYAQLSENAPEALRRGAENGSEIGAFSSLLSPVKLDGLKSKVDEYAPLGLIPIYLFNTGKSTGEN